MTEIERIRQKVEQEPENLTAEEARVLINHAIDTMVRDWEQRYPSLVKEVQKK